MGPCSPKKPTGIAMWDDIVLNTVHYWVRSSISCWKGKRGNLLIYFEAVWQTKPTELLQWRARGGVGYSWAVPTSWNLCFCMPNPSHLRVLPLSTAHALILRESVTQRWLGSPRQHIALMGSCSFLLDDFQPQLDTELSAASCLSPLQSYLPHTYSVLCTWCSIFCRFLAMPHLSAFVQSSLLCWEGSNPLLPQSRPHSALKSDLM